MLEYLNTKDLGTLSYEFFSNKCNKPAEFFSNKPEEVLKNDLLDRDELKKWMKPRLRPSIWKKYLRKDEYQREKKQYNEQFDALFGTKDAGCIDSPILESSCKGISIEMFIKRLIKNLRQGNKEDESDKRTKVIDIRMHKKNSFISIILFLKLLVISR